MFTTKAFSFLASLTLTIWLAGCTSSTSTVPPAITTSFAKTNLVSDTAFFAPAHMDPNLANAWGIAIGTNGVPWIAANHTGLSTVYDTNGVIKPLTVNIPLPTAATGGSPTGIVATGSADFNGNKFIFSTEDGTIVGWTSGTQGVILSDQSSHAVYKGLAISTTAGKLYATDFHNNSVDVFDKSFGPPSHFTDNSLPTGYAPFGIQNINDTLYVTFARQKVGMHDDSSGTGIGYVEKFTLAGIKIGQFAAGGNLNSPWGIASAPSSYGQFASAILIGNFGDGRITAYDRSGNVIDQLKDNNGNAIGISGLWGIAFSPVGDQTKLYFAAGPFEEAHGLFGYLSKNP